MGEHAKLEEVPYFGVGRGKLTGTKAEKCSYMVEWTRERLVVFQMSPTSTGRIRPSGHPFLYVFELLSRQIPADMGERDDEVLNCRKAIWGWAASGSPE